MFTGQDLSGNWEATFSLRNDENIECHESIKLKQSTTKVEGVINYKEIRKSDSSIIKEKIFLFTGNFEDSVLSVIYWPKSNKGRGRGTFCLVPIEDDVLNGKYSWFDANTNTVESDSYVWKLKP